MNYFKRFVKNFILKTGYTVTPNWNVHNLSLAEHLSKIFDTLKIDCVFDVGANEGQYRNFLRHQVGFEGLIISFEPLPNLFGILNKKSRHDPLWIICGYALGAENCASVFHEMKDSQFSSFLPPDDSKIKSFSHQNITTNNIEVEVKNLDSIYASFQEKHGFSFPYLKIDTQGYDMEVIKGAKNSLVNIKALQVEASVQPIYHGMPDYRSVIDQLEKEGFLLSTVAPTNPVGSLYLIEFDCVLVRKTSSER